MNAPDNLLPITGQGGGGKGGGSPRPAQEAPNTLRSRATVRVLEVLSQGEIVGLVNGAKSIYIDDTPVQNSDNTYNFERFKHEERVGLPSQTHMSGFPNVEAITPVNALVTASTPVVFTATSPDTDAMRVTISLGQLTEQDTTNGDLNGSSVMFQLEVAGQDGIYVPALTGSITGKTTSYYERDFRVERPGTTGYWSVRVKRISPDPAKANVANQITFARVTELQDVKLQYENVAYVGVAIDAQATGGKIPARSYRVKGLVVNVPNNYNPTTRVYTGVWNGTFKRAWTDNPAWLLYDLLTNERYGLGDFISPNEIDKFSFYDAAVYNDQLVPSGQGWNEPRFTWNAPIMGAQEAIKAIQDVAGSFNAIVVKEGPLYRLVQDRPTSPSYMVTNANVVDGMFSYSSTAIDQRVTVCNVTYNDKNDKWKPQIETVEADETEILRYGYISTDITALGATTPGQAIRAGKWFLESQLKQKETCSFSMGFNGMWLRIGDVINVLDQDYAATKFSGRIVAVTGTGPYQVTFDRDIEASTVSGSLHYLSSNDAETLTVALSNTAVTANGTTVSVTVPAGQTPPAANDVFMIVDAVEPRQFKVIGLAHPEKNLVTVTCVEHDPNKYNRVEFGVDVAAPVYSAITTDRITAPIGLAFNLDAYISEGRIRRNLVVSWQSTSPLATRFGFEWRRNSGNWNGTTVYEPTAEIFNIAEGVYDVRVIAYSINGTSSMPVTASYTFVIEGGTGSLLNAPAALQVRGATGTTFSTQDLEVEFTNSALNDGVGVVLKDFMVRVATTTGTTLREEYVDPVGAGEKQTYTYSFAKNKFDGGPRRSVVVSVFARDTKLKLSSAVTQTFNNPVPAAPVVDVRAGVKSLLVDVVPGTTEDHAGTVIHASATAGFTPSPANKVYQGTSSFFMIENVEETLYVKAAHYDTFGSTGLNYSSQAVGTPTDTAGIKHVTALPANPAAVNDEQVVYLDVADANVRGLYAWDGTAWKYTRDGANLIANSVTADKLTVANLAAISANMGAITSGSLVIDQTGFIRGGATAYATGTGFWQGYHTNAYKWRVGVPGGAGAEWDGASFKIYGSDGSVTLQSGQAITADWATLLNKPTTLAGINSTEGSKLSGIQAGATVGATFGTNVYGQITSSNVSTYIANAAIGSAQIGSIALVGTSNFSVKTATSGARMEMDSRAIKVFDASGVKRVQLGNLTV